MRKTTARESEKGKRLELERALDGLGRFADGVESPASGGSAGSLVEDRLGSDAAQKNNDNLIDSNCKNTLGSF